MPQLNLSSGQVQQIADFLMTLPNTRWARWLLKSATRTCWDVLTGVCILDGQPICAGGWLLIMMEGGQNTRGAGAQSNWSVAGDLSQDPRPWNSKFIWKDFPASRRRDCPSSTLICRRLPSSLRWIS